jgi:hypothetical protein
MQKWVSNSIAPLCIILLFLYVILYFSSDLIYRPIIYVTNIFIIILLIVFIAVGIFTFGFAASTKITDIQSSWDILSNQSKIYYYDNDINVLHNTYFSKMMTTGGLYLLLGVMGVVNVCFAYQYYEKLTNDWRPPLRARLSDDRAQRYIDLYSKFNKDYKKLYEMENFDKEKDKLTGDKVDKIIDGIHLENDPNKLLINEEKKSLIENKNDEFNVEENVNKEMIEKKKTTLRRRNRNEENNNVDVDENTQLK